MAAIHWRQIAVDDCTCQCQVDDLTDTIFEHHHQPLRLWVLCLYFMGLNLSNQQIAAELDLDQDDVQDITTQLWQRIALKTAFVNVSWR